MARALAALEHGAETDVLDYKGPCKWDGHIESAKLAKDIVAFANSRGGGKLVIGVAEHSSGQFAFEGLNAEQLDSFDGTDMAKWVNSRFAPHVRFTVFKPTRETKSFVVVFVDEFDDMPALCIKDYRTPKGETLLRRGALYVRSANSESKPLDTPDELRRLVGAATARTGAVLLSQVEALLSGRRSDEITSRLPAEATDIDRLLEQKIKLEGQLGLWTCALTPLEEVKDLFGSVSEARTLLRQPEARYSSWRYPLDVESVRAQTWGTANLDEAEGFGLSRGGVFRGRSVRQSEVADVQDADRRTLRKRKTYLEFYETVYACAGRIQFLSHLAARMPPKTPVQLEYGATQLSGRTLITTDDRVASFHSDECQAPAFSWKRDDLVAGVLAAGWVDYATEIGFRLLTLMNCEQISRDIVKKWMELYEGPQG